MPITRRSVLQLSATGALLTGCSTAGGQARPGAPSAPATATATAAEPTKPPSLPDQAEHGPRTRPRLALTFHGQGDPAEAEAVLAAAEKGGARVTVLAVGTWLDAFPQLAARVLRGGHELGNHTQTHGDI